MAKKLIAVTGKNGQLGQELQLLAGEVGAFDFVFVGAAELDITDKTAVPGQLRCLYGG
jgi:dTDP-4-dehydrorhamnose reductase